MKQSSVKSVPGFQKSVRSIVILLLIAAAHDAPAQSFANLNFELVRGTLPAQGYGLLPADAVRGWQTSDGTIVGYNALSLGGPIVTLIDSNGPQSGLSMPIDGRFSVEMIGGFMGSSAPAWIAQTGLVPASARSLMFYSTSSGVDVTFAGHPLTCFSTYTGPAYSAYVADVSAFSGQTGELCFYMPGGDRGVLDNITFWASPVPEPGLLSLALLSLVFGRRMIGR